MIPSFNALEQRADKPRRGTVHSYCICIGWKCAVWCCTCDSVRFVSETNQETMHCNQRCTLLWYGMGLRCCCECVSPDLYVIVPALWVMYVIDNDACASLCALLFTDGCDCAQATNNIRLLTLASVYTLVLDDVFAIMSTCWTSLPQDRPSFKQLWHKFFC